MPVAGTKKYRVATGTRPEVTISVYFTQDGEKFFVPVSEEHYVKLTDQERKDLGVEGSPSRSYAHAVVADKFSEAVEKYKKVMDAVNDTVEGIEVTPMIFVKFGANVQEATELRYTKDGERSRKVLMQTSEGRHFFSSDMVEMKMDFYRVWHIKSDKREGIIDKPLEDCKSEALRWALNRGFRGGSSGTDGRTIYLPWDQATWDALVSLHGHMLTLLTNLNTLISGDDLATKLIAASQSNKMLGS